MLIAFHKPFGVLSQFTADGSKHRTLSEFGFPPRVYPIGRLDADSEGLLLLSDETGLNAELLDPENRHPRLYWVQVEGIPAADALQSLERGVLVRGRRTMPCKAGLIEPQPTVAPRDPPIRVRKNIPERWIAMELVEGKNRQVRHMTAAVGHPTLRLIRMRIGRLELGEMPAGKWRILDANEKKRASVSLPAAVATQLNPAKAAEFRQID